MRDYKYVKVPKRERLERRRTATRRAEVGRGGRKQAVSPAALTAVAAAAVAAALCYGAWAGYRWLTRAELFQIAGVDVQGVRAVNDDDVRALAAPFKGQNIFHVDLDTAARQAMANAWVKDVRVERSLPNRVNIILTERRPRAVLAASNGRFLMDGEGVVIAPVREGEGRGLPVISIREWRAAVRMPVTAAGLAPALELAEELARRGGWDLGQVTVHAESPETIFLQYEGCEFRVGSGNYSEKLRRVGEIAADMHRRGLIYRSIDVRPERQAAVMVIKEGARGQGAGASRKRGI